MTPRSILAVFLAVLLCIGVVSVVSFFADPFGWRKAKVERLEGQVQTTTQQAELSGETVRIIDRTHVITQTIESKANAEAAEIAADSRGARPIDAGLLADWRGRLVGLREAAGAGADPASPGEPSGEVSPS